MTADVELKPLADQVRRILAMYFPSMSETDYAEPVAAIMAAWNTRYPSRADVLEEAARVADDIQNQAAIANGRTDPDHPTYAGLVYAEGVAERIATAIRSLAGKE
jgi:hypothetical protein